MRRFINKIRHKKTSSRSTSTRDPSPNRLETVSNVPSTTAVSVQEPSNTGNDPTIDAGSTISEPIETTVLDNDLPNSSETYEQISAWLEQGVSVVRDISEATPVLSPLKAACMVVLRGLQLAKNVRDNDKGWEELLQDAESHANKIMEDITKLEGKPASKSVLKAMKEYSDNIKLILDEAKDAMTEAKEGMQGAATRFARTSIDKDTISLLRDRENDAFMRYKSALERAIAAKVAKVAALVEEIREDIGQVDPATIALGTGSKDVALKFALQYAYGTDLDQCEPGTRVDVLTRIRQWSHDVSSERVFWLGDSAGTGKSTIAVTMAEEWIRERRLAGRFFFSPNIVLNKRIKYFCRTVAADVACQFPELRKRIGDLLMETPSMESKMDFALQLSQAILQPLEQRRTNETVILVIDALDNCEIVDRGYLLKTILAELPSFPRLKVLLTSRRMQDITEILEASPLVCGQSVQLLDVNKPPMDDVATYVHSKLHTYQIEDRQRIIDHSKGLFIWVATFCRTLLQTRLGTRLLENLTHGALTGSLDALYLSVLEQALSVDKAAKKDLKTILQIVISAFQPISTNAIITFLPRLDQVGPIVQDLAGIIKDGDPDRPLKVLHPTFRDFIASDEERADGFLLEPSPSHSLTAAVCLDVLRRLSFDMLGVSKRTTFVPHNKDVEDVDDLIETRTSAALRYASSYWAHHVASSEAAWTDWLQVSTFLRTHLYYWLEFMSWRGMVGLCHQALGQLSLRIRRDAMGGGASATDMLTVQHASQFLFRHQSIIAEAALHTYTTPVAMVPKNSPLFNVSKLSVGLPPLKIMASHENSWETHMVLAGTGQDDQITRVKMSPDGIRVITVGRGGSVSLWDLESGEKVGITLPRYSDVVALLTEAEFSPDAKYVAIGHRSDVLYLWDAHTGRQVWKVTLPPAPRGWRNVNGVRFSPTKSYIAYATEHHSAGSPTVSETRLYDVTTGEQLPGMLTIQPPSTKFKVSPDGTRSIYIGYLEKFYDRGVLTLVDMDSFQQIRQIKVDQTPSSCISYSVKSDRAVISWPSKNPGASKSVPSPLLIDYKTGDLVEMADDDNISSFQALCLPDGIRMVTLSTASATITFWDARNGKKLSTIRGQDNYFQFTWASPNGEHIATLSNEQKLQVWDVDSGEERPSLLSGHTGRFYNAHLSVDWNRLLLQTPSSEMRVFDIQAREAGMISPETTSQGQPRVLFLSNTTSFILWSQSQTLLELWDIVEGSLCRNKISDALSLNPLQLVSVAEVPGRMCIIYTQQKKPAVSVPLNAAYEELTVLEDEDATIFGGYISFTPSGSHIAISSSYGVQVWDYRTGKSLWKTTSFGLGPCVISSDGMKVAGVHDNRTYLSHIIDGTERVMMHFGSWQTAFHPAGGILVAANSTDLSIWDLRGSKPRNAAMQSLSTPPSGNTSLGFSSDGLFLAYGSFVWEVDGVQLKRYIVPTVPLSLETYHHSLLGYHDGWILSAFPVRPILPVPHFLKETLGRRPNINAKGNIVILVTNKYEPFWIDCSPFLVNRSK